jgi:DNA-binding transcriptional regulator YiaG
MSASAPSMNGHGSITFPTLYLVLARKSLVSDSKKEKSESGSLSDQNLVELIEFLSLSETLIYTIRGMSEQRHITKGSARRIKAIRLALNMSQSNIGRHLGVAGNTVARWERGDLLPRRLAELAAEHLLAKLKQHRRHENEDTKR